jgi:hypothetical protein
MPALVAIRSDYDSASHDVRRTADDGAREVTSKARRCCGATQAWSDHRNPSTRFRRTLKAHRARKARELREDAAEIVLRPTPVVRRHVGHRGDPPLDRVARPRLPVPDPLCLGRRATVRLRSSCSAATRCGGRRLIERVRAGDGARVMKALGVHGRASADRIRGAYRGLAHAQAADALFRLVASRSQFPSLTTKQVLALQAHR